MALDIKLLATVARATNAMYMYITDMADEDSPAKSDTFATIKGSDYFSNSELVGAMKKGDLIFTKGTDKFGILIVSEIDLKKKKITVTEGLSVPSMTDYAKKTELAEYAKTAELSTTYATKEEIANFLDKDLSNVSEAGKAVIKEAAAAS